MRIAYISLHWPRTVESGVGKKILQQIKAWQDQGHETQFFMHMLAGDDHAELVPSISRCYHIYSGLFGRMRTEFERCLAIYRLIAEIRQFKPDVIYLRWSMYVFPAHLLFKIAPVVMEINTNDVNQHGLLGFAYGIYNRMTRGIFLRRVEGLVCASQELAEAPDFSRYKKPFCVITNGIDLDLIKPAPAPNNPIPHLVFIGTPNLPWHGVDKLVELARNFPDLEIDLIGYDQLDGGMLAPANLHLHGFLGIKEYHQVFGRMDVGIGTLALHRKGMEEASPLKTRECLANGIPMVIPYMDSDLRDYESPCLLRIPNCEDNVRLHGNQIRDFAYAMRGKRVQSEELSARISAKGKEEKRLEFFRQVLQSARN